MKHSLSCEEFIEIEGKLIKVVHCASCEQQEDLVKQFIKGQRALFKLQLLLSPTIWMGEFSEEGYFRSMQEEKFMLRQKMDEGLKIIREALE